MSDGIDNHLDQVSTLSLLFISSGLEFQISPNFLSFLRCNLGIRVYVGCSSSGRVYGGMYMGKENPSRVYASLHATVTTTTRVQVHKLFFFKRF
jgi:hypothetical protein